MKKQISKKIKRHNKQYINATTKIFRYVSKQFGYSRNGLKLNTALNIYLEHLGIKNIKTNAEKKEWMLDAYINKIELFKEENINFYNSPSWINLRKIILSKYETKCMKCNSLENIAVDHIYPRSLFPHLELNENNMQLLCLFCNSSKGNRNFIDYRKKTEC